MRIGVIGTGYVGLIQAVGLAELGFEVVAYDIDPSKIEKLKRGIPPIYEKDLEGLLKKNLGRLSFTSDINDLKGCEVFFICVGTPQDAKGKANINFVFSAVESLKPLLGGKEIVVLKSTVPVGTNRRVQQILGDKAYAVSNPEFLREGIAVYDFFNPERVVLGFGENTPEWVKEKMLSLYGYFVEKKVPFVVTNWESAELIKYASNTFLAMKISFVNELARLAEKTGADIRDIATGMGLDSRIGKKFLNAGIGWGGSCFHPKEVVCVKTPEGVKVLEFHQLEKYENLPLEVLSWNGKTFSWKKLKYLTRRFYRGNLVRVRLPLGRGVEVTEDHPMVVYENGLLKQVLAKDLKKGQKILLPSGGLESENLLEVDLFKPLSQRVENLKYKNPAFVKKHFATLKEEIKRVYRYPHDVKRTGVLKAGVLKDKTQLLKGENGRLFTVERNSVPQRVVLDGDLARLLGYFASSGWISEERTAKGYKCYRVGFTFHREETEYIEDLKGVLRKIGVNHTELVKENTRAVVVNSTPFAVALKGVFQTGTNSYDKRVPPQIFESPKWVQEEFLKGLFRGDGSVTAVNGGKNLYVELATVSKELAYGVLLLLQNLGIYASLRVKRFNKSKVDTYLLRINGREQVERVGKWFGERWKEYENTLKGYKKTINPPCREIFENYQLFEVLEVEKVPYEGFVYSVETENGLLIAGGGLLVHNCFPKDVEALIWQFREHEVEPKLPKATKEINEEQLIWFFNKIKRHYGGNISGKTFALLGLAFKPNTDDLRESPALKLAELLIEEGAFVKGFDYVKGARENVRKLVEVKASTRYTYGLTVYDDLYDAVRDADGVIIAVEYKEWNKEDWNRIGELVRHKALFDGRNVIEKDLARELKNRGWHYEGVGISL